MGGPKLGDASLCHHFPNASDSIECEDEIIRALRILNPEELKQRFMYPVWKVMSTQNDYLVLEKVGEHHLEKIYKEISSSLANGSRNNEDETSELTKRNEGENMLSYITEKTKVVCKIIESNKKFLKKVFRQTTDLVTLYRCRLKYLSQQSIFLEVDEELMYYSANTVFQQPGNELIVDLPMEELDCMVTGFNHLVNLHTFVQSTLLDSYNNLSAWYDNFMGLNNRCQQIYEFYLSNMKKYALTQENSIMQ